LFSSGEHATVVDEVHAVVVHTVFELPKVMVGVYETEPKLRPEIVMEMPPDDGVLAVSKNVIAADALCSIRHDTTIRNIVCSSFPIFE
jgi:hypothetical protein